MEERVRQMTSVPEYTEDELDLVAGASNGMGDGAAKSRVARIRKAP
jgi:hypothetical protein